MDEHVEVTPTQARQSVPVGAMRYVLTIGIIGAAVGLLIAGLLIGF